MALKVTFRPQAEADLLALYEYIAGQAGAAVAAGYIDHIEQACMVLATFPNRGSRRDDVLPGLRTIGFERRITTAFRVLTTKVEIVAVAYGGRRFERLVGADED